ncbi:MAG TPA: condensation domain-containing protein, partial [Kofleriaceae bacterium]|jgi:non-ribosomal peptide synthase protein (TIGR01720 family)|nr:condensation domain-containing protein [Kofleriaceae bacterium]
MYRTGDRARRLEDGTLEFLGRGDHQVKFHGHRLELAEVRLAINEHPQIRNSVVRLVKDGAGNTVLAAYYVSRQPIDPDELRGFLKQRLAEEVVPNVYMHLKALPLTLNGKIHFDALPSIEEARQRSRRTMVAPSTPAEEILVRIWCDVLHLKEVSVEDNFFSLGGDSILAIVVISRAGSAGLRLSPRQLFQHQSIAALARVAAAAEPVAAAAAAAASGPLALLPIQRWFLDHLAGAELDNASFVVWLEARRPIEPALVDRALAALWRHHDALRLRVVVHDGGATASIDPVGEPPALLERVQASAAAASDLDAVRAHVEADLRRAIRLAEGRPVAAAWVDLGGDHPGRLAIAAHRFAVDAVSWRILAEQLELACEQLSGARCELPPSTTSLRSWAEWLAAHAASAACLGEVDHWTGDRWRDVAPLPKDRDAAPHALDLAVDRALDDGASRALLDAAQRWRCTLDELLVAALGDVLCAWAGHPVAIDLERHGREDVDGIDLSRTVGWLTSVAPVRLAPHGDAAGLRAVKQELRSAPLAGIGYGLLRYASPDPEVRQRMARLTPATLLFRYTGRHGGDDGARFRVLDTEAQAMTPHYSIVVVARVVDRRVQTSWLASSAVYHRDTLEQLASRFAAKLAALGALEPSANEALVPSDFPLSGLDQAGLARLLASLK